MRGKGVRLPPSRGRWLGGVGLAMLMALAACGGHRPPVTAAPTTTLPSATPTPVTAAELKSMIHGLVNRNGPPRPGTSAP